MKYEPLKGKERVVQFVGNLRRKDGGIHKMLLINRGFLANDVKSAVQGLLEEIKKEAKKDEDVIVDKTYTVYRIIIPLIKKWFADVVE